MRGGDRRPAAPAAAILTLAICGLAVASYLTYLHVRLHCDPSYVSVCAFGQRVNCETVAASSYSVFLSLPVSVWGILGYVVLAVLAAADLRDPSGPGRAGLLAPYGILLGVVSAVLAAVSSFEIGAICLLCTATYAINWTVMAIGLAMARRRGGLVRSVAAEAGQGGARLGPVLFGLGVALVAVAALRIGYPRYWEMASWRYEAGVERGVDDDGYPWIGAADPAVVVHEYTDYECPHCRLAHLKLRRLVADHPEELRLVRHDYGRMRCAPNDAKKRLSKCDMVRAAICAAREGRFWAWNDAVMASPRPLQGTRRETYIIDTAKSLGMDAAALDECMYSAETIDRAQEIFRETRKRRILDTPGYVVDGRRIEPSEVIGTIEDLLSP